MVGKQKQARQAAACTHERRDRRPCGATPRRGKGLCFWHDPDSEQEATEARRLGGLRRRREKTVAGAFEFDGLGSVESIRRVLEIAVIDALGLDNSIARTRVLIAGSVAAARLLEVGQFAPIWAEVEDGD